MCKPEGQNLVRVQQMLILSYLISFFPSLSTLFSFSHSRKKKKKMQASRFPLNEKRKSHAINLCDRKYGRYSKERGSFGQFYAFTSAQLWIDMQLCPSQSQTDREGPSFYHSMTSKWQSMDLSPKSPVSESICFSTKL